jgi:hypothetical protein
MFADNKFYQKLPDNGAVYYFHGFLCQMKELPSKIILKWQRTIATGLGGLF